jgi:hypothetical protein
MSDIKVHYIDEDETPNIDDAPPQDKALMREHLRMGRIVFSEECLIAMKEMGISEEEIISMMRKAAGLDS